MSSEKKGKIVGIGGIFFKSPNPEAEKEWYSEHLGIKCDQWGAPFVSRQYSNPEMTSFLQWSPFPNDTNHFSPSDLPYMINYRVEYIEDLVIQLREKGVTICDDIATYEYGKFVHIIDHVGRKVELWEPVDKSFDELYKSNTDHLNYQ